MVGYVASVGTTAGLAFLSEWLRIAPSSPLEFAYLLMVGLALVPVSLVLVSTIAYIAMRPSPMPRAAVTDWPPVAILYVAYNDALPEAIRRTLANLDYPNAEVWLLSDSSKREAIGLEGTLPEQVRVFRRPERRGGKAGAINDWLRAHGPDARYVVPMDADAILAPGSLRVVVEIAEHPRNRQYAGFQTLMEVHPAVAPSAFARVLGRSVKWSCRIVPLANQRLFGQGMYWGSNALFRADVVSAAGGWVEDNICEDFALTARLDAAGHPVALVDLYNFEGFPPDALSLRERTVRWCKANLSVAPSIFRMDTGFAVRLNVVTPLLFYLMAPVLLGLLLVGLVAPSGAPLHRANSVVGGLLLAFVFLYRLAVVPRNRQSLARFGAMLVTEMLVILSMSLRVAWAFVEFLLRPPTWVPSRKGVRHLSGLEAVKASMPEIVFGVLLILLIASYRPPLASVALSGVWIASFLSAPVILWASSRPARSLAPSGRDAEESASRRISF